MRAMKSSNQACKETYAPVKYVHCKFCGSRNKVSLTHCYRCERDLPLGVLNKVLTAAIVIVAVALAVSTIISVFT